jgi:hypothetical protein
MDSSNKWYNNKVLVIFLIIIFFPVGLYGLWKSERFSNAWKAILTVLTIVVVFAALSDSSKSTAKTDSKTVEIDTVATIDTVVKEVSKWYYSEKANEMDDNTTYFAQVEANEALEFEFPYNGGSIASIIIRSRNGNKDAMLQITKGQFMTKFDNNAIRVKFDKNKPVTYSFSEPSDGSTTTIFIGNSNAFIQNLKKSSQTIIECEFYNEGVRTMKFDTKGLVWKH